MAKRTSKQTAKRTSQTSSKKPADAGLSGSVATLDTASVAELERALAERKRGADRLLRKREKVAAQLADIDSELAELGISPSGAAIGGAGGSGGRGGRGGRRPRNDQTLPEAMAAVMKGQELRVREIAEAVLASGYQSSSASFTTIVSQALGKDPKQFKKVSRGVYTVS